MILSSLAQLSLLAFRVKSFEGVHEHFDVPLVGLDDPVGLLLDLLPEPIIK